VISPTPKNALPIESMPRLHGSWKSELYSSGLVVEDVGSAAAAAERHSGETPQASSDPNTNAHACDDHIR